MIFVFDVAEQHVSAFKNRGQASKAVLAALSVSVPEQVDPVRALNQLDQDDHIVLTLSEAFDSIACTESELRQELALKFKRAVDDFYQK